MCYLRCCHFVSAFLPKWKRPWWPFCVLLPSSGRGVTGRLSLSLEAKALSEDAGGPADDEDVDTAVVLPVSVALSGRPLNSCSNLQRATITETNGAGFGDVVEMDGLCTVCGHVRWFLRFPRFSLSGFCPYWSPARRCYASSGCSPFAGMFVCFIHFIHILLWKGHSLVTGRFLTSLHLSLALYTLHCT